MPTNSPTLAFEYWSDPLCIWAYVAQVKLDRLLNTHGPSLTVRYHIVPVFGSMPWRFSAGSWAAAGPEGRREATERIARDQGFKGVTGETWTSDAPASSWAPGMAIKAVLSMEDDEQAPAGSGALYQRALRAEFFEKNRNTARRKVQLDVATSLNLNIALLEQRLDDGTALAALWEDEHHRTEQRIQGSPTYLFDGGRARLYGNFDESVLQATVLTLLQGIKAGGSAC